jgi:hypothetical protein
VRATCPAHLILLDSTILLQVSNLFRLYKGIHEFSKKTWKNSNKYKELRHSWKH